MSNLQKLKAVKGNSPVQVPVKVLVVAVAATSRYRKNDTDKSCTEVGVADSTAAMKMLVYDESKLAIIKENAIVLLRNTIVRDDQIIVTSATLVSKSSGVVVPDEVLKAKAKSLVIVPPAPVITIAEARQTRLDALVSLKGKITKEESVAYRDMPRTGEMRVPVKNITIEDITGETRIGLWRNLATTTIRVGNYIKLTQCKINVYRGEISFNSTSKSELLNIEAPVETLNVMIDGHYAKDEEKILVCCLKNTDTYLDYVVEDDILQLITGDQDIEDMEFPLEAQVSVQKRDNKDYITSVTIF